MSGAGPAREYRDGSGLMLLAGAFLLPPAAWFLDLQVSYTAVKWACEHDARTTMLLLPIGTLVLLSAGFAMAWSCWSRLRGAAREDGGNVVDRSYFLAISALALNGLFALLVLTSLAPRYFLSPCE